MSCEVTYINFGGRTLDDGKKIVVRKPKQGKKTGTRNLPLILGWAMGCLGAFFAGILAFGVEVMLDILGMGLIALVGIAILILAFILGNVVSSSTVILKKGALSRQDTVLHAAAIVLSISDLTALFGGLVNSLLDSWNGGIAFVAFFAVTSLAIGATIGTDRPMPAFTASGEKMAGKGESLTAVADGAPTCEAEQLLIVTKAQGCHLEYAGKVVETATFVAAEGISAESTARIKYILRNEPAPKEGDLMRVRFCDEEIVIENECSRQKNQEGEGEGSEE